MIKLDKEALLILLDRLKYAINDMDSGANVPKYSAMSEALSITNTLESMVTNAS